ncbi:MAG: PorV/PorQ family protein [Thermaurantimonas sp.]|uniref:PorV/PorQ family protein n=1 Tax=Thermaurantimonas sp. TaxID=2681568 RepID=UPI00391CA35C
MRKILLAIILPFWMHLLKAQVFPSYGGERAGLSALTFLKNDINPRSVAIGGASSALNGDAFSILSNPAALVQLKDKGFTLANKFIGAGVNQSFVSFVNPQSDQTSVWGFSLNSLTSGYIKERTEFMPGGTGREFSVVNMAFGATYAKLLSEQFSFGLTMKYVYEHVAGFNNHTAAVDLSFLYKTDFKKLQFAAVLHNFGGSSSLASREDIPVTFNRTTGIALETNPVPTVFSIGMSIEPYRADKHALLAAFQISHPNDNSENIRLGAEYSYDDQFFGRLGYKINVLGHVYPTAGVGAAVPYGSGQLVMIDYAFTATRFFGSQHLIGVRFMLSKSKK